MVSEEELVHLFVYRVKKNRLRTQPCGTPMMVMKGEEMVLQPKVFIS